MRPEVRIWSQQSASVASLAMSSHALECSLPARVGEILKPEQSVGALSRFPQGQSHSGSPSPVNQHAKATPKRFVLAGRNHPACHHFRAAFRICCFCREGGIRRPGHGSPVQATVSHSTHVYRRVSAAGRKKIRPLLRSWHRFAARRTRYSDDARRTVHAVAPTPALCFCCPNRLKPLALSHWSLVIGH